MLTQPKTNTNQEEKLAVNCNKLLLNINIEESCASRKSILIMVKPKTYIPKVYIFKLVSLVHVHRVRSAPLLPDDCRPSTYSKNINQASSTSTSTIFSNYTLHVVVVIVQSFLSLQM